MNKLPTMLLTKMKKIRPTKMGNIFQPYTKNTKNFNEFILFDMTKFKFYFNKIV